MGIAPSGGKLFIKFWSDHYFIGIRRQPRAPPTEGAVGDDEMLALGHEPEVGVGHRVALVVVDEGDAPVSQRDPSTGGVRTIRKQEVMRTGYALFHLSDRALVVIAGGVISGGLTGAALLWLIKEAHMHGDGDLALDAGGHLLIGIVLGWDDTQVLANLRLDVLEITFALPVALEVQRAAWAQAEEARIEIDALLNQIAALLKGEPSVPAAQQVTANPGEGFQAFRRRGCATGDVEVAELVVALVFEISHKSTDVVDSEIITVMQCQAP